MKAKNCRIFSICNTCLACLACITLIGCGKAEEASQAPTQVIEEVAEQAPVTTVEAPDETLKPEETKEEAAPVEEEVVTPVEEEPEEDVPTEETVEPEQTSPENEALPQDTFSLQDIYQEISKSVALQAPMEVPSDYIENFYALDLGILEEYVFSISELSTSSETIILMKVKDGVSTELIKSAMQLVVDEKKGEMENYLPTQYELVARSKINTKGNYVWLVISENDTAIQKIISNYIQ